MRKMLAYQIQTPLKLELTKEMASEISVEEDIEVEGEIGDETKTAIEVVTKAATVALEDQKEVADEGVTDLKEAKVFAEVDQEKS